MELRKTFNVKMTNFILDILFSTKESEFNFYAYFVIAYPNIIVKSGI